jgi:myo-inositol-1(or 4)-monophosphatase
MEEEKILIEIVSKAGQIFHQGWRKKGLKVHLKGEINPVTEIDKEVELYILENLTKAFPGYGILSEECGKIESSEGARWIIDPLDGTTNYIKGYPFVAISVALEKEEDLVLGLVHNPILNEMYLGKKGQGATCNGKPIHISEENALSASVLASGFPYDAWDNPDNNLFQWNSFLTHCRSLRCDGSAALDLCRVASGQLDGYWEKGISPWDIAAGIVVVREAGGMVTDYSGNNDYFLRGEVIAANPVLHKQMIKFINRSY